MSARTPKMQASTTAPAGGVKVKYEFEKFTGAGNGTGAFTNIAYQTDWVNPTEYRIPTNALEPNTQYRYRVTVKDQYDTWLGNDTKRTQTNATWWFTTKDTPVVPQSTSIPADGAVLATTTPTLKAPYVPDPVSSVTTVKYKFVIATGSDGQTGTIVSSGWLTPTDTTPGALVEWPVPTGSLQDGGSYTWRVWADDGVDTGEQAWIGHFKIDLRLGTSGPSPYDTAGPADGEPGQRQPGAELRVPNGEHGRRADGDGFLVQLAGRPERQWRSDRELLRRPRPGPGRRRRVSRSPGENRC